MNRLLIDLNSNLIEWDIQNIGNSWVAQEFYNSVKVVTTTNTYKVVSLDDSITYCEIPIQITVLKYITNAS